MDRQNYLDYLMPQLQYSESEVAASKQTSLTTPIPQVSFETQFAPTLSYYGGKFFMAISYLIDGVEAHQRVPLDAIQVANLVSQGAKSLAAHVSYDLKLGVSE